jgi:hypothetical protein
MKNVFIISVGLFLSYGLSAQTPPTQTWFYNEYGQKTKPKEKYSEDENGFRHGKFIAYDYTYNHLTNSFSNKYTVFETGNYNHGKKQGEWKTYSLFYEGVVASVGSYQNDSKEGLWKEDFSFEDKLFQEGNYLKNVRNGKWMNVAIENGTTTTKKGYSVTYSNGVIKSRFDGSGKDISLLEKVQNEKLQQTQLEQEKAKQRNEQMETDFNFAMSKYQTDNTYYGDTLYLREFLIKYPDANSEYVSKAKEAIKDKVDNDAFYFVKDFNGYLKYQKKFPSGIHKEEAEKIVRDGVLNNTNDFITAINKLLEQGNPQRAIEICEIVLRYKNDLHNSQYLPVTIYYSLGLWGMAYDDKAIEVIKPYNSSVINYSDGNRKFSDKYFEIYNQYKKPLGIDADKETYKKIKAL